MTSHLQTLESDPVFPAANLFLASLPREEYGRLRPHFEQVELPFRMMLYETGEPIQHCTFFDGGGMISLTIRLEDGAQVEAGLVGNEGFAGLSALMGDGLAVHASMVQMPGVGTRIESSRLRDAMLRNPAVLDRVLCYSQAITTQISQTAVCNAHHSLEQRLARWILMAHDRAESDELPLTQELLAGMLAVHRPSVTLVAQALQRTGAIDYGRGRITVLDRKRLEAMCCECYGMVQKRFQQLLGWPSAESQIRIA